MDSSLLLRYLSLQTDRKETAQVERWLADDPDGSHAEMLNDLHNIFDGLSLHLDEEPAAVPEPHSRRTLWSHVAMAAAVAGIVVSISFASAWYSVREKGRQLETVSVPQGSTMQLTLEDGSVLWMNSGTLVERPRMFSGKDRTIYLREGEVMLDVSKDPGRPFHVVTPSSDIEVLGTRFDVCLEENTCTTTLLRGSIRITSDTGEVMTLKPYDVAVQAADGSLSLSSVRNSESVECWTQGVINLVGHPFDELMKMFEKSFDMTILVARDEIPEIRLVRGKVRIIDGVEHALDVLSVGADFKYEVDYTNNLITIK